MTKQLGRGYAARKQFDGMLPALPIWLYSSNFRHGVSRVACCLLTTTLPGGGGDLKAVPAPFCSWKQILIVVRSAWGAEKRFKITYAVCKGKKTHPLHLIFELAGERYDESSTPRH